jgi:hypothetical protein
VKLFFRSGFVSDGLGVCPEALERSGRAGDLGLIE